jgi:hypothetical protein
VSTRSCSTRQARSPSPAHRGAGDEPFLGLGHRQRLAPGSHPSGKGQFRCCECCSRSMSSATCALIAARAAA